jgi:DNA polymerase kappa
MCPQAYLNVTTYLLAHPDATGESVAREVRHRIEQTTRLTASAGIACNMLLAKICSNQQVGVGFARAARMVLISRWQKPNGQFALPATREAVLHFMRSLPTAKLHGVGKVRVILRTVFVALTAASQVTDRLLETLGVRLCSDVYQQRAVLAHLLTSCLFHTLLRSSLGIGTCETPADTPRKSVGREQTFAEMSDKRELLAKAPPAAAVRARD